MELKCKGRECLVENDGRLPEGGDIDLFLFFFKVFLKNK